ncbi:hypothetical protein ACTL6P_23245 [Endozoicomonas acroporae]|uniref:hypothetical protein n=1 Tax=Endozoicomonas acroporae TaxID=1701104 RepID=UPI000C76312E|nr:hypothetical protein [Endozoicomonas acroporae]
MDQILHNKLHNILQAAEAAEGNEHLRTDQSTDNTGKTIYVKTSQIKWGSGWLFGTSGVTRAKRAREHVESALRESGFTDNEVETIIGKVTQTITHGTFSTKTDVVVAKLLHEEVKEKLRTLPYDRIRDLHKDIQIQKLKDISQEAIRQLPEEVAELVEGKVDKLFTDRDSRLEAAFLSDAMLRLGPEDRLAVQAHVLVAATGGNYHVLSDLVTDLESLQNDGKVDIHEALKDYSCRENRAGHGPEVVLTTFGKRLFDAMEDRLYSTPGKGSAVNWYGNPGVNCYAYAVSCYDPDLDKKQPEMGRSLNYKLVDPKTIDNNFVFDETIGQKLWAAKLENNQSEIQRLENLQQRQAGVMLEMYIRGAEQDGVERIDELSLNDREPGKRPEFYLACLLADKSKTPAPFHWLRREENRTLVESSETIAWSNKFGKNGKISTMVRDNDPRPLCWDTIKDKIRPTQFEPVSFFWIPDGGITVKGERERPVEV